MVPSRLVRIAVEREELDGAARERVVALVARQREVVEVGLGAGRVPVVIAQRWEEAVLARTGAVFSRVRADERGVELADVRVDRVGTARRVVVVARRDHDLRVVRLHELGDATLFATGRPEVADHRKA